MIRRFVAVLVAGAAGLSAAAADWGDPARRGPVHPIVFPVLGRVSWTDTFGAPRGARVHAGQDLMGEKMQPLLAVADSVVGFLTIPEAPYGYMLRIDGDDGWTYSYLHLNNDTPGTDDGRADLTQVFGPGIATGARVRAGQVVGYMGDSGNAESTAPHLHFEMRDPSGALVNPAASLDAAMHLDEPVQPADPGVTLTRIAGPDRVGTAVAASRAGWPSGADAAVVADGARFAEALPASVLAARVGGPLLLAAGTKLPEAVRRELRRLGARTVWVVGSVPVALDAALRADGLVVRRIGSAGDSVATAAAVAAAMGAAEATAVVVNAGRFADAVSASGLAAARGWPVLLVGRDAVPGPTAAAITALGVTRTVVVGGPAVVAEDVFAELPAPVRLAGGDRYATSASVASEVLALGAGSVRRTYVATGTDFPDSLAAGVLAARRRGVVLLVDGTGSGADVATAAFVEARPGEARLAAVLGGPAAVGPQAAARIAGWFADG